MLGGHFVRSWSTTQQLIALSSGEAEYYALVKVGGMAIGHKSMMDEMHTGVSIHLYTDSSAARGIAMRTGLGKLRHIEVHTLWLQQKAKAGVFDVRKVNGKDNPADAMTKHLTESAMGKIMSQIDAHFMTGRASSAPQLSQDVGVDFDGGAGAELGDVGPYVEEHEEEFMVVEARMGHLEQRMQANDHAKEILQCRRNAGQNINEEDVLSVLRMWSFSKNVGRQNVQPDGAQYVLSDTLGLVGDRRGNTIASKHTFAYPHVSKICNQYLRECAPSGLERFWIYLAYPQ